MTAMESIADVRTPEAALAIPRFEDGFVNMQELLRFLAGAVMCDMDEAWSDARYFSEARMAELYDERQRGANGEPLTEEQLEGFRLVARQAIEVSLQLADMLEAA